MLWIKRKNNSSKAENRSDAELIDAFKSAGDSTALGILFERYVHLVYGVCMKYLKNQEESRDATMQIFEKIRFDLLKYNVQKFSFWLHTVSKNYCLMQKNIFQKKIQFYIKAKGAILAPILVLKDGWVCLSF